MARTTIRGEDLEEVILEALANLLESGDDLAVSITLPAGTELEGVTLKLEADVVRDDEPSDADTTHEADDDPSGDSSDDSSDESEDESNDGRDARESAPRAPRATDDGLGVEELEDEAEAAADFIEGVLDAMDLPGDLRIRIDEVAGESEVELLDIGTGALIGRRGQTLEALQELLRCSMQREFERRSRVKVDIEGYRARRLEKLIEKAVEAIEDVTADGEPVRLEPMDVFERKAIHRLVGDHEGVTSRSQGREPGRRVVVEPA